MIWSKRCSVVENAVATSAQVAVEYRHKNDGGDSLPAASRADTSADSKPGAAPIPDARTQPSLSKYCF
jgi:hypothetical protein